MQHLLRAFILLFPSQMRRLLEGGVYKRVAFKRETTVYGKGPKDFFKKAVLPVITLYCKITRTLLLNKSVAEPETFDISTSL